MFCSVFTGSNTLFQKVVKSTSSDVFNFDYAIFFVSCTLFAQYYCWYVHTSMNLSVVSRQFVGSISTLRRAYYTVGSMFRPRDHHHKTLRVDDGVGLDQHNLIVFVWITRTAPRQDSLFIRTKHYTVCSVHP